MVNRYWKKLEINTWKKAPFIMKLNYLFTDILVWNMLNDWIEPYNNSSVLLLKAKSSGKKSLEVKKAGIVKNKDISKSVNIPGKLELLSFSAFVSLNPICIIRGIFWSRCLKIV